MSKPVVIKILGDASSLSKALGKAEGGLRKLGGFAANVGKVTGAAGVAVAGASVKMAVDFESSMADVFTLLPGMSEDAFADMGDQVKDLSSKMGVLPSEVVPALYDAISAGVPTDNVFAFMETAAELAIGGSIELSAAVDLLTTSQNAWAESGLTGAEAADLATLAVRNGKLTMGEFSSTLSTVAPIAAAFGVSMEDTAIGMAALTAQGIPASVASTQLKGVFAELGKEGTKAAGVFEGLAGQSFPEFIAAGGNLEGAMQILADSGDPIIDMFGSIEAGAGALALTADDMNGLSTITASFAEGAAGASAAAYEKMASTSGAAFDKIKANVAVLGISLGEKLLPVVAMVTDYIIEKLPAWRAAFSTAVEYVSDVIVPKVVAAFEVVRAKVVDDILPALVVAFGVVKDAVVAVYDWVVDNWDTISDIMSGAFEFIVAAGEKLVAVSVDIVEKLVAFGKWVKDNDPVLVGLAVVLAAIAVVIGAALVVSMVTWTAATWAAVAAWWALNAPMIIAMAQFALAVIVIAAVAAAVVWAYQNVDFFRAAIDWMKDSAIAAFGWLKKNVPKIIENVIDAFKALPGLVKELPGMLKDAIVGGATWLYEAGVELFNKLWDGIKFVFNLVKDFVTAIPGKIKDAIVWGASRLYEAGEAIFNKLWDGIKFVFNLIKDYVLALPGAYKDAIVLGASSLYEAGEAIFNKLWDGIKFVFNLIKDYVLAAPGNLKDNIVAGGQRLWEAGKFLFNRMKGGIEFVYNLIKDYVTGLPGKIKDAVVAGAYHLYNAGSSLIGRMKDGIVGAFASVMAYVNGKIAELQGLANKAQSLFNIITNPVKFAGNVVGGFFNDDGVKLGTPGNPMSPDQMRVMFGDPAQPMQHGGPLSSGLTLVGERGPELFDIPNGMGGGSVIANQDMDGVGGGGVVVNVSTNADPWAIGAAVAWELRRAG